jgi:hypothetical protein
MAAESHAAGRGQIVSRVDSDDPGTERRVAIAASRRIQMAELASRTGFSKRWVIELLRRLDEKNLIRIEGGSGVVKWTRLLPPGVSLLGDQRPTTQRRKRRLLAPL